MNASGFFLGSIFRDSLRGGNVNQDTSNLFNNAGNNGNYWSSTPRSNGTNAYNLNFGGTSDVNPSNNNNRYNGRSVRCLLLCPISIYRIVLTLTNQRPA